MTETTNAVPNPGSQAALDAGCKCAVIDNHYGKGFQLDGETVFWMSGDCPLHGMPLPNPPVQP